jgi:hypothetical protein
LQLSFFILFFRLNQNIDKYLHSRDIIWLIVNVPQA